MRNKLLDQSRLFAAFLVILIHSPVPGAPGIALEVLGRMAVPFFFMISGYFAYGNPQKELTRKLKKTAILLLWSVAIYFLWGMLWSFYHRNPVEKLLSYFCWDTLLKTFLLNEGVLLGHLWYVLALLYCYAIYKLLRGKLAGKGAPVLCAVLLALHFLLREWVRWSGLTLTASLTRNFLFTGLPFFLIGTVFARKKLTVTGRSGIFWAVILLIGLAAAGAERLLYQMSDLYLGTIPASIAFFALSGSQLPLASKTLSTLGQRCSTHIYVFHSMVLTGVNMVGSVLGVLQQKPYLYLRPLLVLAICLVFSAVLIKCKEIIKHRRIAKGVV